MQKFETVLFEYFWEMREMPERDTGPDFKIVGRKHQLRLLSKYFEEEEKLLNNTIHNKYILLYY